MSESPYWTTTTTTGGGAFTTTTRFVKPVANSDILDTHVDFIDDTYIPAKDGALHEKGELVEMMCPLCGAPIDARVQSRITSRDSDQVSQIRSFTYEIDNKQCDCPIVGFVERK